MAAPSYGTDVVTLDGSVYTTSGTLTLADYAAFGGGAAGLNLETDYYLLGTTCISKDAFGGGARNKGIVDDTNSGGNIATTLASGNNPNGNQYVYIWCFWNAPASLEVSDPASGDAGLYMVVGPNTNNYDTYHISGSDLIDYGADWICATIDVTNQTADNTVGSGSGGNFTVFGCGANIPVAGPTKGSPFAIEGVRRGAYIEAVEGEVANPVTFSGLENFDGGNATNGRIGIFTERRGVYVLNTEVRLGSASTLCYMDDNAGTTIRRQIDHTLGVDATTEQQGGKHLISIRNASSTINWTNLTILEAESGEGGIDIYAVDNATINFTACSFFGVRLLRCGGTNTTLLRCTLPRDHVIILANTMGGTNTSGMTVQNGATITSCTVDGSSNTLDTSGIDVSGTNGADLSKITNCNFTGNGRALLLGTIDADTTLIYDGHTYESGYTTGATQSATAGPQGTSNAVIQCAVNTGVTLTISVQNTDQIPSVYNTGSGSIVIAKDVVTTVSGILGNTEIKVLPTSGSPYSGNTLSDFTTPIATERVSADTITGNGSSDYVNYSNNGGFVQINATGLSSSFSNFPGVLQDTNASSPRNLTAGDKVRVTIRDDADNPSLQLFDEFEVSGTPSSASILTTTSFSGFESAFGTTLNSANSKTVTVEKVDARFQFSVPSGTVIDFLVFRTGSDPVLSLNNTIVEGEASFPLTQSGDRNYRDPA